MNPLAVNLAETVTIGDVARILKLDGDFRPNTKWHVPWRVDNNPSLWIWSDGLGYCDWARRGEAGWAGDAIAFYAQCTGRTYREAFAILHGHIESEAKLAIKERRREKPAKPRPGPLSERQIALICSAAQQGFGHPLIGKLAEQRDYARSTLRNACLDHLFGWVDFTLHDRPEPGSDGTEWPLDGVLCFVYGWGVKCRWRDANGRQIRWLWNYGLTKPSLWNGPAHAGKIYPVKESKVWIAEGETDALRLMELGVEGRVMAAPSASYSPADWELSTLSGKNVVLAIDNDKAGNLLAQRLIEQLSSARCVVSRLQLPESMDVDEAWKARQLRLPN